MISLGVENVPELHEDEYREQHGELLRREFILYMAEIKEVDKIIMEGKIGQRLHLAMLEILDEAKQHSHENQPDTENAAFHLLGDDESVAGTRLVLQHAMIGRQRSQSQGRKGVHNQVDPQHLGDGKRRGCAQHRANQDNQAGCHVDGHLEEDKALNVNV